MVMETKNFPVIVLHVEKKDYGRLMVSVIIQLQIDISLIDLPNRNAETENLWLTQNCFELFSYPRSTRLDLSSMLLASRGIKKDPLYT